jgi:hypothetical protein
MYGKCLNIRNVLKHGAWNGLYIWFVRRYSWLSISMHRVCRQMAHIMLFNSFVWCVWWVLRSELEVMFGHSEKFSKSQRPSSNMIWLWKYIIYIEWHSGSASDCGPGVPSSIPIAVSSFISCVSMLTYLSVNHSFTDK